MWETLPPVTVTIVGEAILPPVTDIGTATATGLFAEVDGDANGSGDALSLRRAPSLPQPVHSCGAPVVAAAEHPGPYYNTLPRTRGSPLEGEQHAAQHRRESKADTTSAGGGGGGSAAAGLRGLADHPQQWQQHSLSSNILDSSTFSSRTLPDHNGETLGKELPPPQNCYSSGAERRAQIGASLPSLTASLASSSLSPPPPSQATPPRIQGSTVPPPHPSGALASQSPPPAARQTQAAGSGGTQRGLGTPGSPFTGTATAFAHRPQLTAAPQRNASATGAVVGGTAVTTPAASWPAAALEGPRGCGGSVGDGNTASLTLRSGRADAAASAAADGFIDFLGSSGVQPPPPPSQTALSSLLRDPMTCEAPESHGHASRAGLGGGSVGSASVSAGADGGGDVHRLEFYQNNSSMARSFFFPDGLQGAHGAEAAATGVAGQAYGSTATTPLWPLPTPTAGEAIGRPCHPSHARPLSEEGNPLSKPLHPQTPPPPPPPPPRPSSSSSSSSCSPPSVSAAYHTRNAALTASASVHSSSGAAAAGLVPASHGALLPPRAGHSVVGEGAAVPLAQRDHHQQQLQRLPAHRAPPHFASAAAGAPAMGSEVKEGERLLYTRMSPTNQHRVRSLSHATNASDSVATSASLTCSTSGGGPTGVRPSTALAQFPSDDQWLGAPRAEMASSGATGHLPSPPQQHPRALSLPSYSSYPPQQQHPGDGTLLSSVCVSEAGEGYLAHGPCGNEHVFHYATVHAQANGGGPSGSTGTATAGPTNPFVYSSAMSSSGNDTGKRRGSNNDSFISTPECSQLSLAGSVTARFPSQPCQRQQTPTTTTTTTTTTVAVPALGKLPTQTGFPSPLPSPAAAATARTVVPPLLPLPPSNPLTEFQRCFEDYQVFKGRCTEAYLTKIERTVDAFLSRFYNPPPYSDAARRGAEEAVDHPLATMTGGGGGRKGSAALLNKAGAKLSHWFKQATATINGTGSTALPGDSDPQAWPLPSFVASSSYVSRGEGRVTAAGVPSEGHHVTLSSATTTTSVAVGTAPSSSSSAAAAAVSAAPASKATTEGPAASGNGCRAALVPPTDAAAAPQQPNGLLPARHPMYPLRYTANAVPEDYIDRAPSERVLRSVELNYPIILHALKHLLPPSLPQSVTAATAMGEAVVGVQYPSVMYGDGDPAAAAVSALVAGDAYGPTGASEQPWGRTRRLGPRELAVAIIAKPGASIPFSVADYEAICSGLLLPTVESIWQEYLHPLEAKLQESIGKGSALVRVLSLDTADADSTQQQRCQAEPAAAAAAAAVRAPPLPSSASSSNLPPPLTAQQQQQCLRMYKSLQGDAEYIATIDKMDREFVQQYERDQRARQGLLPEDNSRQTFLSHLSGAASGVMSDYVPVYGLVMSRLHRLEIEHRTILELWDPTVRVGRP